MVRGWQKAVLNKEDTPTLKAVVGAFRAAVRFGEAADETSDDADEVFTFSSGHVFNLLMQFCLAHMDGVLRRHVAGGKAAVAAGQKTRAGLERPDAWAHWRRHQPLVKSYLTHLMSFMGQLSEASMIAVTLQQAHRLLPFFCCLPKLAPKLLKATLRTWSAEEGAGGSRQITLLSFAIIRQLGASLPYPFVEHSFKGLYLTYAQACRATSRKALPHVVLMASCFVDLCTVDPHAAYRHAFVYIRQLAIHLRNAIQKATPEASRQVCNWQYINCLRLWAQVLCAHARAPSSPLRQLVYPLVQVTLGAARLLPSIRYAPLRFHCARLLNQLSAELGVYVPVAPLLLESFDFSELSKSASSTKMERPLDLAVTVKVSATDSGRRAFQEGMVQEALYLISEHVHNLCHSIGFPEMVAPCVLALRAAAKDTKIVSLQKRCKRLLVQIEAQAKYVSSRRDAVDFPPSDAEGAAAFLADEKASGSSPFARWFAGEKADFQKAESARQQEALEREKGVAADNDDEQRGGGKGASSKKRKGGRPVSKKAARKKAAKAARAAEAKRKLGKGGSARSDGSGLADEVEELRNVDDMFG